MTRIKNPKTGRQILIGGVTYKKLLKENPNIFDIKIQSNEKQNEIIEKKKPPLINLDDSFDDDEQCIICMNARASVLLLPCEHNLMCKNCSDKIKTMERYDFGKQCIMCRQEVHHILD